VVLAALTNALRVVGKKLGAVRVTMAGAGAAGTAVLKLLLALGASDVIICDDRGAVHQGRPGLTDSLRWVAERTNAGWYDGDLAGAVRGADVFIGVSAPNILTGDDVAAMAADAIVFALANPLPEVDPDAAGEHATVVATGRSDYPNQINNVWRSPASSAACSTRRAGRSPMTCWSRRPARWPGWCPRPSWALTTSSRRCSIRT
jgi:malate dehydrogenase (oxaloacetate-decarboxylating)